MYIYTHCIYIYTYTCIYTFICIYMYIYIYTCIYKVWSNLLKPSTLFFLVLDFHMLFFLSCKFVTTFLLINCSSCGLLLSFSHLTVDCLSTLMKGIQLSPVLSEEIETLPYSCAVKQELKQGITNCDVQEGRKNACPTWNSCHEV